jgi:hypothetical protein
VPQNEVIKGESEREGLKHNVTRATYHGRPCVLKTHHCFLEDRMFPAELRAYALLALTGPHFVEFIGYLLMAMITLKQCCLSFVPNSTYVGTFENTNPATEI